MRERHPSLDWDVPADAVLWRYMDFPKFVSMLHRNGLFFSRSDRLGDRLEGSLTQAFELERQARLKNPPEGRSREDLERVLDHNRRVTADGRLMLYINCWHLGDHESMALWQGYGSGPYAVAIRTTFGLLDSLLPEKFSGSAYGSTPATADIEPPHAMPIFLTQVRYIDHTSTTERLKDEQNLLGPFVYKSIAYRHENEVRAIQWDIPAFDSTGELIRPLGVAVPLDLQALVTDIVVSPLAPEWFTDVVRATFERYGFAFNIRPSLASASPVF